MTSVKKLCMEVGVGRPSGGGQEKGTIGNKRGFPVPPPKFSNRDSVGIHLVPLEKQA